MATNTKILVVEDDALAARYLSRSLLRMKYQITGVVKTAEAIIENISKNMPDIVLMDIQLPVMDGYTALSKIREARKDIVVIAQTAYGLLGDKEKILNSGFNDYVIKPILSQNLIEKLVANLNHK